MLMIFFLIILALATVCLYAGIRYKMWLPCAASTILFLVLAFQAFLLEIPTGGVVITFEEPVIVLLMWFAAIVGLIFTLVGAIEYMRGLKDPKHAQRQFPGT